MSYLIDSNILLRSVQTAHPMHTDAKESLKILKQQGELLCLAAQNIYEFWVVATRPQADNGLGFSVVQAVNELVQLRTFFTILEDTPAILTEWETMVTSLSVLGKNAHDARLVAAMKVHGISHLLTFNSKDFQRFQGITVSTPQDVTANFAKPQATP